MPIRAGKTSGHSFSMDNDLWQRLNTTFGMDEIRLSDWVTKCAEEFLEDIPEMEEKVRQAKRNLQNVKKRLEEAKKIQAEQNEAEQKKKEATKTEQILSIARKIDAQVDRKLDPQDQLKKVEEMAEEYPEFKERIIQQWKQWVLPK